MEKYVFPVLFFLCGGFAAYCAFMDYEWFMGHRRAKMVARLLGRNGTRVFYITMGVALMVVAVVVYTRGGFETPVHLPEQ